MSGILQGTIDHTVTSAGEEGKILIDFATKEAAPVIKSVIDQLFDRLGELEITISFKTKGTGSTSNT